MTTVKSPLKWHGGKHFLASKIVALMPPHTHYVEPYAGGLSVLFAKDPLAQPEGVSEVINDLDRDLTHFWRVLQNGQQFAEFQRLVEATPFSEVEWDDALDGMDHSDPVERAAAFFLRCRQSLSGRMKSFTGITKTRTRRRMNNEVSAWLSAVEGLPAVHARLKRVLILNRTALDVIRSQDGPGTLFYLDPPYLAETRTAPNVYRHEMGGLRDHAELLVELSKIEGKFLLSGYPHKLYRVAERQYGWRRTDFDIANHAAAGDQKRRMTECVWSNF